MKKVISIVIISMLSLGMLLGYQNCGQELPESLYNESGVVNNIYDMKMDQIAYMSCSEQRGVLNEENLFFTLRAGGYNTDSSGNATSGLKLSNSFLSQFGSMDKFDILDYLYNDPVVGGSQIQFSVRKQSNLSSMFVGNGQSGGAEGLDYDFTFGVLGSEELSASLITTNTTHSGWLNYWAPAGINMDAYFEGSVTVNGAEADSNALRSFLSTGGGLFTAAFSDPTDPAVIRKPNYADDEDSSNDDILVPSNTAMGVGLKLDFKQPTPLNWGHAGTAYTSMPKRVLSKVIEYDLANPKVAKGSWTCPNELQLKIVYNAPGHLVIGGVTVCSVAEDPASPSALLKTIRNTLPAADWYVDLTNRCVVPRRVVKGSCYGIDTGTKTTRQVQYDFTTACNPDIVDTGAAACPHFISICTKTQ